MYICMYASFIQRRDNVRERNEMTDEYPTRVFIYTRLLDDSGQKNAKSSRRSVEYHS